MRDQPLHRDLDALLFSLSHLHLIRSACVVQSRESNLLSNTFDNNIIVGLSVGGESIDTPEGEPVQTRDYDERRKRDAHANDPHRNTTTLLRSLDANVSFINKCRRKKPSCIVSIDATSTMGIAFELYRMPSGSTTSPSRVKRLTPL